MVHHHEHECHVKWLVLLLGHGHSEDSHNENMIVSNIVSKLPIIRNQTQNDGTSWEAGESCEKIGLLCSSSRSQERLNILVNVCSDYIFWILVTVKVQNQTWYWDASPWVGVSDKIFVVVVFATFQVKVTVRTGVVKIWLSTLFPDLVIPLQPNFVCCHHMYHCNP